MKRLWDAAKNRRGSQIIEASVIYPLIILFTVAMIGVSICLFENTEGTCDLERSLRRSADRESGTVFYAGRNGNEHTGEQRVRDGFFVQLAGTHTSVFFSGFGQFRDVSKEYPIRRSIINECRTGWDLDLIGEFTDSEQWIP